jgi:hypothetical protein
MQSFALNLKVDVSNTEFVEVIDELDSVLYPQDLLSRYFSDLFKELSTKENSHCVGLKKAMFLQVSLFKTVA